MKFASVAQALKWFYNRGWFRPPSEPSSIDPINVKSTFRAKDVEKEMVFFMTIDRVLKIKLSPKQAWVLFHEFKKRKKTQSELAAEMNLAGGDRCVRRIRDKAIKKLEMEFMEAGILSKPRREVPQYAHS